MLRNRRTLGFMTFLLVVAAALVFAGACRKANESRAEKAIENAMEKASGGKADVDLSGGKISVKTDQGTADFIAAGGKWPEDVPGDVPKFEGGKVTATLRGTQGQGKTWTIAFDQVETAAYAKYVETIKAAGYAIITTMDIEDGAVTQARKGKTVISLTLGKSAKSLGLNVMTEVE
jgi:hypothetical protein